ncbi:MAG: rhomboid family intramembrane serine protease [Planctomycetota bacterium]
MFLPLGTDRPRRRPTVITYWLIVANVAMFTFELILWRSAPDQAASLFGDVFQPGALVLWPEALNPLTLVSYQFLHGGFLHLAGNMLFLYVFGPPVEDKLGRWWFLGFYLLGGIAAGVAHMLFEPNPVVGASGSIAAVSGAFLVMFPLTRVRILLWFFVIGVFHLPAWWLIAFAIAKDMLFQGLGGAMGVAYLAHLGGYAFGAGVAFLLLWLRLREREPYDLFSIGKQAARRRRFKEITSRGAAVWSNDVSGESGVLKKNAKRDARLEAERVDRERVLERVSAGALDDASEAYDLAVRAHGRVHIPRDALLRLANHLYQHERSDLAMEAYETFLTHNGSDREAAGVRVVLALIYARRLNDPVRAKQLLVEARQQGLPADQEPIVEMLESELG